MISSNSQDAIEILTADRNEWKRRSESADVAGRTLARRCDDLLAQLATVTAERDAASERAVSWEADYVSLRAELAEARANLHYCDSCGRDGDDVTAEICRHCLTHCDDIIKEQTAELESARREVAANHIYFEAVKKIAACGCGYDEQHYDESICCGASIADVARNAIGRAASLAEGPSKSESDGGEGKI